MDEGGGKKEEGRGKREEGRVRREEEIWVRWFRFLGEYANKFAKKQAGCDFLFQNTCVCEIFFVTLHRLWYGRKR